MIIKDYDELSTFELDALKEVGSIGSGNAATALSDLIQRQVRIQTPEIKIMGYNEAIDWIGGPEEVTAGVLVKLGGQINGIMMAVQKLDFINIVLESMLGETVEDYFGLHELESSALTEVGNIVMSTFINALTGMVDIKVDLSVPAFAVDMQGAIMAVPMAEFGGQTNYIMTIGTRFFCNEREVPCQLLLSPDIRSLNFLLRKLGVERGS